MSEDINVGAISEALNNKVDLNQMNTNAQGLSYASGWGMPSSRYIDLPLGASDSTYIAPANGWVMFNFRTSGSNSVVSLYNITANYLAITARSTIPNSLSRIFLPVKKAQVFRIEYSSTGTPTSDNLLRFIYAEGEQ